MSSGPIDLSSTAPGSRPAPAAPLHERPISLGGDQAHPRAALLLHGLCGTPLEMAPLARHLHQQGWRVEVPYLRGYGTDVAHDSRRVTPWQDWAGQAGEALRALRQQHGQVAIAGLCIGAVLALKLAQDAQADTGQPPLTALALLSPTLHFDGWNVPWYQGLLPLAYHTPLRHRWAHRETEPFGLKNERLRRWIRAQMHSLATSNAGAAELSIPAMYQARRLIAHARARLNRITAPCLAIHAREDDMATPRSSREVLAGVASSETSYIELGDSYHMITMDNEREAVARATSDFFARHARRTSSTQAGRVLRLPGHGHSDESALF